MPCAGVCAASPLGELQGSQSAIFNCLFIYLFIFFAPSLLCCPLCFQSSAQIRQWEGFLVFGNFSLFKTPFLRRNSVPPSFVSFFVFCIFSYLLSKSWAAFLGAWCLLPAFRSCFVEFTRRLLFWWICGGESVLPVLLLRHLGSSPKYFKYWLKRTQLNKLEFCTQQNYPSK